jgi:nicotinamidase/pyrazinamidase
MPSQSHSRIDSAPTSEPRRYALVVIDFQIDLCRSEKRAHLIPVALDATLRLIEAFQQAEMPVCYTQFVLAADDPQFARFGDVYCVRGTPGAELVPELHPQVGPVFQKTKHSAFVGTDLDQFLRVNKCQEVVLVGMQTQICILLTAADAYHRGFDVSVVPEAVVSTQLDAKLDALAWIDKYVGRSKSLAAIEQELKNVDR